ncbi:hypothetical protein EYZ11_011879 [Aspergillus tanneri]|uniref:Uncharacterized protein n=1 Tax=Aspergillus tanneri TaxID=1220188 RepID=A0A4S3J289_9EURO|nr:uncharacterized protein ATNIH1004_006893 [Aspergillus tanneri]KAA8645474.1 hypothetical protein ATNIH1004_006893 [Aspergillus tanneri]THC88672.1 hypothetical protein EYZ11_011879 [Aspergillus tanneri]
MTTPTLINLPPPPSDPVTPTDMGPGTPNSGTTSLSALSTTAIKDGHQGQPLPHGRHAHHSHSTSTTSATTLEAERADRISRLAGLERVATARAGGTNSQPSTSMPPATHTPGYFDSGIGMKERSTVGSASATGSVGARTTWASGSDAFDADKMSEDPDDGTSSVGNMSDEGDASLVGFGEGASTVSGPISHPGLNRTSSGGRPTSLGSPNMNRLNPIAPYSQLSSDGVAVPPALSPTGSITPEPVQDARMVDGMTYDPDVVDTTVRTPRLATPSDGGSHGDLSSDQRLS